MKHVFKLIIFCSIFLNLYPINEDKNNCKGDLVIFSFDRPLQLYALLESLELYVSGIDSKIIIYRTSNDFFDHAYQEVMHSFPQVEFRKQCSNPRADFKHMTLDAVFNSANEYIMFAVDDIIIKDYIDIKECIELIEKHSAYGFYPWLGKNISRCYSYNDKHQPMPKSVEIEPHIFAWQFSDGSYDWNYPHTVDFALYRKKDIEADLRNLNYCTPNTLEASWASQSQKISQQKGICFECSKSVNLPLNRVSEFNNRHMNFMSPAELLELFMQGMKIDMRPLFRMNNNDPHTAYKPTFIKRN